MALMRVRSTETRRGVRDARTVGTLKDSRQAARAESGATGSVRTPAVVVVVHVICARGQRRRADMWVAGRYSGAFLAAAGRVAVAVVKGAACGGL